jgi:hypothetical protein
MDLSSGNGRRSAASLPKAKPITKFMLIPKNSEDLKGLPDFQSQQPPNREPVFHWQNQYLGRQIHA